MVQNKWRSSLSTQGNSLVVVNTFAAFTLNSEFFAEGFKQLTDSQGANMTDLTQDELFKTLLNLALTEDRGFLGLLVNKKGAALGYIAAHNTTNAFRPQELTVFAIYANGKCPSATRELMFELRNWAQSHGYKSIKAQMYKKSGAGMRFFNHVLKMRLSGMTFQIDL